MIEGYLLKDKLYTDDRFDVYRAITVIDKHPVVIKLARNKLPTADDISLLKNEYKIHKFINMNQKLKVQEFFQTDDSCALILENIKGIPLYNFINNQPISLDNFFILAMQLIDIIYHLHQNNIIYNGLNSKTIFLNNLSLMLTDYSPATQLSEETKEYSMNSRYLRMSPYSAPEQTGRINRSIDYRTDFYSLGVIFFEMLTGSLPFTSDDSLELTHQIIVKNPPSITEFNPEVPSIIVTIIEKLLSKMSEERYASILGLKADLLECVEQWGEKNKITPFIIGQKDIHDHLNISQRLYGRSHEVETLLSTFDRASNSLCELVLIGGYSGVGKTSLVKEVHKPIVQQNGYFIQGKYDQLRSYIPFNSIVTAFKDLIKQVLSNNESTIEEIKIQLLDALDNLGQVVIDLIPDVELIIGKQPPVPVLNTVETNHRFNLVFKRFVQVFAQAEHPVVMFLDDLQWVDSASLNFIENLLVNNDTENLLIIGAYRDNEVDHTHPLYCFIEKLKKESVECHKITVNPLSLSDITHLLTDTLSCTTKHAKELAIQIRNKTKGNPFFINVFLKMLYQERILKFSYSEEKWEWDLEKIKNHIVTDNVVDLLTSKINQLPFATQEILKLASCFGHQFDLNKLTIVSCQTKNETASHLWLAIQSSLIVHLDEIFKTTALIEKDPIIKIVNLNYRFAHDKVQQAAYELIPSEQKPSIHLRIGRLLLEEEPLTEQDDRLFEIMEHFNQGLELISDNKEKQTLALYNLWAGLKAKKSSAYQAANEYLQAAATLLKPLNWNKDYNIIFSIYKELAVCKYLTSNFEDAKKDFSLLLKNSKDTLDKIEIYRLNCEMLSTLNKHEEAITLGLQALQMLKIKIPRKVRTYHILNAIIKIKMKIGRKNIPQLKLLPNQSIKNKAAIDLITQLLNNAFIIDQKLFVLLTCTNINLSLIYGYTESNAMSFPVYAFAVMHSLNMYQEGIDFVELIKNLTLKYGTTSFEGKTKFILGAFIVPWRYNIKSCLDILSHAFQLTYNNGDLVYANYSKLLLVNTSFFIGRSLKEIEKYIQRSVSFTEKAKISDFSGIVSYWKYAIQCLQAKQNYDNTKIKKFEQTILEGKSKTELWFLYGYCTKLSYLFGHYQDAYNFGERYPDVAEYGLGMVTNVEYIFYYALSITSIFQTASFLDKARLSLKLIKIRKQIKRWRKWCPVNFTPYFLLLEAEIASIHNKQILAISLYEQAIDAARDQNAIYLSGIANECAGKFYLNQGIEKLAKFYLTGAYADFYEFGAISKCKLLEETYPQLSLGNLTQEAEIENCSVNTPSYVDMLAILKSAEIISSEIHIDQLRKKLLLVVLQVGGAEHGVILLRKSNRWVVEAEGDLEKQNIYLSQEELVNEKHLPLSLLHYVQRTSQPVIIEDANKSELTLLDPYVQTEKPRSLLMLPILYQGQFTRILYIENKKSTQSFTTQNLQSLQLIASSAMISLENARLYHQASHDSLTGLANRNLLDQVFKVSSSQALRLKSQLVFLFFDLDNFKNINDSLGHEIGDKLLKIVAQKIKKCLREGDLAARVGGDEFAALLAGIEDINQITVIADRLSASISEPVTILNHQVQINTSMGICIYPKDAMDMQTLLKLSDIALYQAKEKGKNQYYFYSEKLQEEYRFIHQMETGLQVAIAQNQFCIYYQPIFSISGAKLKGFEALLRWQHPTKGLLYPADFIGILEQKSAILPVSEWVIDTVCQQAKSWKDKGLLNVPISINTSAVLYIKKSISQYMANALQKNNLGAEYIELELTESIFLENQEKVFFELNELLKLGIKLVIDDFGTGYSSLAYLKRLPVSKLKIDKSFFRKSQNSEFDFIILDFITNLAHKLNLEVIAEGIEDEVQLQIAQNLEIDGVQGYYYSLPMSTDDCEKFLLILKSKV